MSKFYQRNIVYETRKSWVYHDKKQQTLTVYRKGVSVSNPDSAYTADIDGLSIALARADWIARVGDLPRLPLHTPQQLKIICTTYCI